LKAIMMGACGLVQPAAALQFFRSGRFGFGTSLALTIGSIPGVLLAAFVVKQLPLTPLRFCWRSCSPARQRLSDSWKIERTTRGLAG
jgi:hypothetical protein